MLEEKLQNRDYLTEAIQIKNITRAIREDIFSTKQFDFDGRFTPNAQQAGLPSNLLLLISMLLNGSDQVGESDRQEILSIAQIIVFNMKKRCSSDISKHMRHNTSREPALPLYLSLNARSLSRNKKLIDEMHKLGLGVSYN